MAKRGRPKAPRDFLTGMTFETIKCPTCNEKYRRMRHDRDQIVCPRCLNKTREEDEGKMDS